MKTRILHIFTRTPLHVGAGSSVGAVDQPVQREIHTGFPIIPGSSIKGTLRDHLRELGTDTLNNLFGQGGSGEEFKAGGISFGEARLLLFPIRSAKGSFAFITSPIALRRYARDAGLNFAIPAVSDGKCLANAATTITQGASKAVVLEEYRFNVAGEFPGDWATHFSGILSDAVLTGAGIRLVVLSDGDLSHFARTCCQISQHVRISDETGTAEKGGLFNEETVPSETLFYAPMANLRTTDENAVFTSLGAEQLVQFGGSSTTGLGFCTIKLQK